MSAEYVVPAPPVPYVEPDAKIRRGALLALLTIPAGVVVYTVIWGFGFIASIVGAGVAFLALWLYLKGAGRITRAGAIIVLAITAVTLLLAFFAGIVLDAAKGIGDVTGLGAWGAFTHEQFWPTFWDALPDALPEYVPDLLWAIGFGALGSFATLRGAFAAATQPPVVAAPALQAPQTQQAPEAGWQQGTPGQP